MTSYEGTEVCENRTPACCRRFLLERDHLLARRDARGVQPWASSGSSRWHVPPWRWRRRPGRWCVRTAAPPPCLPACVLCTQGTRRARAPANTLTRVTPCRRPRSRWRSTFSWRHPRWRQPRAPPRAGTRACAACFFFRRRRTLRQRRALAPPGPPGSGVGRLKCAFRARLGRCSNTVVTQTGPGWTTPDSGTPDCLAPRTLPRAPRSAPPCLYAASSPSALGT